VADEPKVRKAYDEELWDLRDTVLRLGTFAREMLTRAMDALTTQNTDLAWEVRRSDNVADELDREVERVALRLLALQQPVARDLRAITGALRIATDLERVADYAKDIAKVTLELATAPYYKPLEDIPLMGARAAEMVQAAVRAFAERDLDLAVEVARMDGEVDVIWKRLGPELVETMQQDPTLVLQATHLLLVARYLERVGDHVVNVAERVSYIETGRIEHLV
jgi:phosphate transport system protein